MFEFVSESLKSAINKLKIVDDEKALKNALDTLKKSLLKSDVHHKITKDLVVAVENDLKNDKIGQLAFINSIKKNLTDFLSVEGAASGFVFAPKAPTVVLMCGLQGGGKTTTTIKLANYVKTRSKKVLVAACDLQRLAAVEQLRQLCEANEIELFTLPNETNPVKVAKAALKAAQEGLYDALFIDSAGRLAIDEALMSELEEIKRAVSPFEIFYVADAMTGQGGVRAAESFHQRLTLTGVILSKFDADTKGGVALGIARQTNVPLRFVGVGEKVADIEPFVAERIVGRILGEGDLATLAEKTASVFSEKEAKNITRKIKKGEFNFNDFLAQLESVKKLGSVKNLIGMIPGMSQMASKLGEVDLENSAELRKIKAMISSMTLKERENPSLLNNTRKRRIALGAGLTQMEVNRFLKQFETASKMAKKFASPAAAKNLLAQMNAANNRFK